MLNLQCLLLQGPLGCRSLSGLPRGETLPVKDIEYLVNANENVEISAMTWETAIHKHVEEEFYASSTKVKSVQRPSNCLRRG